MLYTRLNITTSASRSCFESSSICIQQFFLSASSVSRACSSLCRYDYEFRDAGRLEMKRNFSPTKEFVDQYLNDVVNHPLPFGDEEKNELTLEASAFLFKKQFLLTT